MSSVLVYLVRHGETDENRLGVIQGQLDTQLNNAGRQQVRHLASALENVEFQEVFVSSLSRAVEVCRVYGGVFRLYD